MVLSRRIFVVFFISVGIFCISLWARQGSETRVRFIIDEGRFSFYLDGNHITTEQIPDSRESGGIGYYQYKNPIPILPQEQRLKNITVTDSSSKEILFSEPFIDFESVDKIWDYVGKNADVSDGLNFVSSDGSIILYKPFKNIIVDAVISNIIGAKFYFRLQNSVTYTGCFFRPFRDFDSRFYVLMNNKTTKQYHNKTTLLSPVQIGKRTLDLLLHYFPSFFIVFFLFFAGGFIILFIVSKCPWILGVLQFEGRFSRFIRCHARFFHFFVVLILIIFAFFWVLNMTCTYLEKIPHVQDSATMVFQAKMLARGMIYAPVPSSIPHFQFPGFLHFKNGKMFSQYPIGHPLFLVPGIWFDSLWIMPAIGAILLLFIVYLLGKSLYKSAFWGSIAAILLFCSPFFQMSAANFMSHTTGALYCALSLYFLYRARDSHRILPAFSSGLFLGLLFNTRPMTAFAVGISIGVYVLIWFVRSSRKKDVVKISLVLGAGLSIFILFFLGYNYLLMGDPFQSTYGTTAQKVTDRPFDYERISKAFLDNFTLLSLFLMVITGWCLMGTLVSLYAHIFPSDEEYSFSQLLFLIIAMVFFGYMFYSISSATVMYGPRYVFEISFVFILLIVGGARRMCQNCSILILRFIPAYRQSFSTIPLHFFQTIVIISILAGGLTSFVFWTQENYRPWPGNAYVPQNVYDLRKFNHVSPKVQHLIEKYAISNALVFVTADKGRTNQWWHFGSVMFENSPLFDTDLIYARDLGNFINGDLMKKHPTKKYYRVHYEHEELWEIDGDGNIIRLITPQRAPS